MKRYFHILLLLIFIVGSFCILNIEVNTRQCVNYDCHSIKLPLYLKLLGFFDRHYNYKNLVNEIVRGASSEEERSMRIFEWTYKNIKRVPRGLPVIDDHIWWTIIRGYGTMDQFSDIFTTLCNHAGIKAFFTDVSTKDGNSRYTFSFVRIKGGWVLFDPYNGVYFKDKNAKFSDIDSLSSGNWKSVSLDKEPRIVTDYSLYFENLSYINFSLLTRASIQSPFNRLLFELKKRLNI